MTAREPRRITDSATLAALAHPLRRRLLDLLLVEGPATASTLAERTGQAVGNISHHVRSLAAAALIEEAPELARDRRERWWRRVEGPISWSARDFDDDDTGGVIEQAAASLALDRATGAVRESWTMPSDDREWWGEAPFAATSWLRLTPAELDELGQAFYALLERFRDRGRPGDDDGRRPVLAFGYGVPAAP